MLKIVIWGVFVMLTAMVYVIKSDRDFPVREEDKKYDSYYDE